MRAHEPLVSVVIPCYNEGSNVALVYQQIKSVLEGLEPKLDYELIYVNDGSTDSTYQELERIANSDEVVRLLSLSRNFGKEIATTAGIRYATGDVILTIDGDGQHPPELIPSFLAAWQAGGQVVIGVRTSNQKEGFTKHYGSKLFYRLLSKISREPIVPGSTDFRLIDKAVQQEFIKLTEHNRMTRGLVDWLGFRRVFIPFKAKSRLSGKATYSHRKLLQLAINGFVSSSLFPLYLSLYLGLIIVPLALIVGIFSGIEMLVGDPLSLRIHGTAFIAILILFSAGVLLISQGFIALYLSRVHTETQNRPLFVVDQTSSHNIDLQEPKQPYSNANS